MSESEEQVQEKFIEQASSLGISGEWHRQVPVGLQEWWASQRRLRPKVIDAVCVLGNAGNETIDASSRLRPVHYLAAWLMTMGHLPEHLPLDPGELLHYRKTLEYLDSFMEEGQVNIVSVFAKANGLSFAGKRVALVEVKARKLNHSALGQAQLYERHFRQDWPGVTVESVAVVCKADDPLISSLAKELHIKVFKFVPKVADSEEANGNRVSRPRPDIRVLGGLDDFDMIINRVKDPRNWT